MNPLGLPFLELKKLYSAHLFLVEFGLPNEVSLFILSLRFLHNKKTAFDYYHRQLQAEVVLDQETLDGLKLIEDREINGVVVCMIAQCYYYMQGYKGTARDKMNSNYAKAFRLLSAREETSLSSMELYFKAMVTEKQPIVDAKTGLIVYERPDKERLADIHRLYLLCMAQSDVYRPVFCAIAEFLYDYHNAGMMDVEDTMENVMSYYTRGRELGCSLCILRYGLRIRNSEDIGERELAQNLIRLAASMGNTNAMAYINTYHFIR